MPTYCYACKAGHEYEQILPMAECNAKTKCPKCGKVGKKIFKMTQAEPSFSDKLFPYWDKSLNKVFNNPAERKSYLKEQGLEQRESKGSMNLKQERMMYEMRIGNHDPRDRRYAN